MRNVINPGIWLITVAFLLAIGFSTTAAAKTIYVDNDGPADFDNIQSAIDDSNDGDVIVVAEGTYFENINFRGKNITLRSTDANDPCVVAATIINGQQNGSVVTFENGEDANCVLNGFTITNGDSVYGGGAQIDESSPTVINCVFDKNYGDFGGAALVSVSSSILTNCVFKNNHGVRGGGICIYPGRPIISKCIFIGNSADYGGGMFGNVAFSKLINCTFSANLANVTGGGIGIFDADPILLNCIVWDNKPEEIYIDEGSIVSRYNNIRGGCPGEGNINADPCFADPNNGDYHLKSQAGRWEPKIKQWVKDNVTSPCIDAGDPASPIGYEPFPNGGIINMGAYGGTTEASKSYFGEPPCETTVAGDINGDCIVNFKDFALMAFHWLEER